jgi:hypothetical protein
MTIEMPSKEKSSPSEPSKSSYDPSPLGTAANIASLPSGGGGGGGEACCSFVGANIAAGILFPPYGLLLLGGIAVTAFCCCCGYAAYRSVRKNVYVPEEEPQFTGIE